MNHQAQANTAARPDGLEKKADVRSRVIESVEKTLHNHDATEEKGEETKKRRKARSAWSPAVSLERPGARPSFCLRSLTLHLLLFLLLLFRRRTLSFLRSLNNIYSMISKRIIGLRLQ
jgi:hypothetical protein